MRGHVDAESLALYAEGLLSRRQSARIRAHLSGCPECAAAQQQLTGVAALLGQVPATPLPPAVAARLDLALAAEAGRRAADPAAAAGPRTADDRTARRNHRPPTTGRARGHPGAARAAPPAPRARAAEGPRPGRGGRAAGRRWGLRSPATLRLVSVAAAAVILAAGGYGRPGCPPPRPVPARPAPQHPRRSAAGRGAAGVSSGPLTTRATVGQQAASALAKYQQYEHPGRGAIQGSAQGTASASSAAAAAGAVSGTATRQGATGWPVRHSGRGGHPAGLRGRDRGGRVVELVDRASYDGRACADHRAGRPRQPAAGVWVTGPGCSAGHLDKITEGPLGGG